VVATVQAKAPFSGFIYDGWLVNKYDAFNRTVYTAWYQYVSTPDGFDSTIRKNFQNIINSNTTLSENRLNQQITMIDNIQTEYSNQVIPNTGLKLLSVNYYDVYSPLFSPNPLPTIIEGQNIITNVKGLPISSWVRVLEDENSTNGEQSYTLYDNKYRPVRSYTKNYLGGYTQVDSNIDWAGKTVYTLTKHKRIDTNTELTVKDMFSYSDQDKLLIHKRQINSDAEQLIASNIYDELGQLISKKVGGTDVSGAIGLQKVDYNYNIRGWLKGINDIDDIVTENDLFAFKINYNDPETAQPLFNGNIAETLWKTSADNKERKYNYTYDHLNRLLQADYAKNGSVSFNSYLEAMTYDKNGNILTLVRNGDNDTDGLTTVNNIDNLTYTYDTNIKNQLLKVFDTSSNPQGFKDNTDGITDTTTNDYSYDANGNLIRDDNKGITLIEYNHLNLPTKITFGTNGFIEYFYNALGQKVKKMVLDPNAPSGVTTDYLSGFQYKNGILQFFPHAEGYVNATATIPPFGGEVTYDFNYVYNYTDHLGNIRLSYSVDPASQEVKIMEENHYYPFGLKHTNYNSDWLIYGRQNESTVLKKPGPIVKYEPVYKYKYNGKEYQDELGLNQYDYGARNYDPALGRWMNIDPLASKYESFSTYNYCLNNPVFFVDPDGKRIIVGNIDDQKKVLELFNKTLGGNYYEFDENNNLKFTGNLKDFKGDAKDLINGINKIIDKDLDVNIKLSNFNENETQLLDEYSSANPLGEKSGGLSQITVGGKKNEVKMVNILIRESDIKNIIAFDKKYSYLDENNKLTITDFPPQNIRNFETSFSPRLNANGTVVTIPSTLETVLFHELGHTLFENKSQTKVNNFENLSRKLLKIEERPTSDPEHN